MQPTAELETFTAPESYWERIVDFCLRKTKFSAISSLRADLDERIDKLISEEFGPEGWRPCGMGPRSEDYDRLAFAKVLRQPKECAECRSGRRLPDYCDSGGKLFEVFKQGGKIFVWYRPALCERWLKTKAQAVAKENTPVETGRRGFGR